ncbi:hypothetical protein EWM64_g1407 [Hericium alpestre]|uniref:ferric-chelate reductase (NADPH) n=1 Tax=Hericium alpestre TaxID=135208 RepID=A0A4Z0A8E5_9AGAM|nr:hypothetical protein EWM64_g1407 [Hericium alpestre]
MADRLLKAQQQRKYVKEFWLFLTAVIGILAFFRLIFFLSSFIFRPQPATPGDSASATGKEKTTSETVEPGCSRRASWRRLPSAAASVFRIVAFRWTIPIGLKAVASVSELTFIIGYVVAIFIWLLIDTRDLETMFWEDRAAHFASSNLALVVALAGKNNVISFLTGVGHEKLNVLHRAAARTCLVLLWMHALAHILSGLPEAFDLSHTWMRMGAVGLVAFTLATVLSLRPFRQLAFEFFLVSHIVLIAIFLISGVIHTRQVGFDDYIWPALMVWGFDRFLRLVRVIYTSRAWGRRGWSQASIELLSEDTIRLTLRQRLTWTPGQHAYVILPTVSTLPTEAHPFTIASIPGDLNGTPSDKEKEVVFLIRGRDGFTGRLREHAVRNGSCSVPAMLDGPYGCPPDLRPFSTCILIAGGSGVSYTLPLMMEAVRAANQKRSSTRRVVFVWAVRDAAHLSWISEIVSKTLSAAPEWLAVEPRIYVTGTRLPQQEPVLGYRSSTSSVIQSPIKEEKSEPPSYNSFKITYGRPSISRLLQEEMSIAAGPVSVDVAGPSAIAQSVRSALKSGIISPLGVLKGDPTVVLHVETFVPHHAPKHVAIIPPNSNAMPAHDTAGDDEDDEEDAFVYPVEEEEFVYPADLPVSELPSAPPAAPPSPLPPPPHATSAQLEALYAAAASGDLALLQNTFRNASEVSGVDAFSMANDASSRTGLTALHAAASRGYLEIVKWLIETCGAMPDLEDKEGETAIHKAALHGHLHVIKYLISRKANAQAQDADGWTALHNACSKGYLDIVRWLCERGGACAEVDGTPGIDIRSKGGWTPLMNAASKGHLPIVLYLLTKRSANPLIRNNWGETAYDAAAAVFEVWICEVLSRFEADRFRGTTVPYDPLAVHTTVPLILYENQRLDNRLKTLAVSGGRPRFSASGLGKHGRRPPFELKLLKNEGQATVPAWRSDVQLPLREEPLTLPIPGSKDHPVREGSERSHFWLSDWTLDVTHPGVDAETGWQYAHTFDDSDDQWTPEPPAQLERLLTGDTIDEYAGMDMEGQELGSMPSNPLTSAQDYVARARYLAGVNDDETEVNLEANSAIEARRAIAKLERATTE